MRLVLLALVAATLPATLAASEPPRTTTVHRLLPKCSTPGSLRTAGNKKPGIHRLGDEPPASQVLAVLREVDGCPAPIVLREGIGAQPANKVPVMTTPARPIPIEPG